MVSVQVCPSITSWRSLFKNPFSILHCPASKIIHSNYEDNTMARILLVSIMLVQVGWCNRLWTGFLRWRGSPKSGRRIMGRLTSPKTTTRWCYSSCVAQPIIYFKYFYLSFLFKRDPGQRTLFSLVILSHLFCLLNVHLPTCFLHFRFPLVVTLSHYHFLPVIQGHSYTFLVRSKANVLDISEDFEYL